MEIDLVSRENREEMRNGLRTIKDHLDSLNEISAAERKSSAQALKELKRELRRDLEDQVNYQYQCQQSMEDSLKQLTDQLTVLTGTVATLKINKPMPLVDPD